MGQDHPYKITLHENKLENATENQKRAMRLIEEHWPTTFTELEEIGKEKGYSHNESYYRKYYYQFFGPEDDKYGRTFDEIQEIYGDISVYDEHRYKLDESASDTLGGDTAEVDKIAISERESELIDRAMNFAFKKGMEAGQRIERAESKASK